MPGADLKDCDVRRPTWRRWWTLRRGEGTLARLLMHEEIAAIDCRGATLDLGGGARSSYIELLGCSRPPVSVNLDPSIRPSVLADLCRPLPFRDSSFDTVLSFNTLEHLADDRQILDEARRVLRPGGRLHILVPFLYRVHGSPDDHHRHTDSAWRAMIVSAGFEPSTIQVRPLVWDPLATAWSFAEVVMPTRTPRWLRRAMRGAILGRTVAMRRFDRRWFSWTQTAGRDFAVAYSIKATSPT